MVLSTPVISYRNSPPLSYGATPRRIMDAPAEPRPAFIAVTLLGYAILSIAMTLAFKAALQAFPYPASLVAATFVVEAALVKSAECGARAAACVFPKEENTEQKRCCVFPDETDRLLMYVACCVGAEVALSNAGLLLLSVATHTMIKACTPVFVLGAGLALKLEPCRWSSILIVLVICAGTVLCSPGVADHHREKDSLLGVLLTVSGGAVGGLRWGLTQKACQKGVRVKPTELVRRTLPTSAAFLVLVAGVLDARRLIRTPGSGDLAQKALGAALALALGGLGLLTVEVTLVALTSSLTLAVAAVAKELVLIGVSIGLLKNDVSPSGYGGFALTASGVLAYNVERYKRRRREPPPPQTYEQVDLRPPSLVSVPPMDDAELA
jgi:hypothetical protein